MKLQQFFYSFMLILWYFFALWNIRPGFSDEHVLICGLIYKFIYKF